MRTTAIALVCGALIACQASNSDTYYSEDPYDSNASIRDIPAPQATVRPKILETHGHKRVDDYYWLRERENAEVISYLEAENSYTEKLTAHTKGLQETLFEEIKGRIKQSDESVPYRQDDYFYYTRYENGKDYPIYCRKRGSLEAREEVIVDANDLAKGHGYFGMRGMNVSTGQNLIAFGIDTVGRRKYDVHFKNLATGTMLEDKLPQVTGNLAWANDDRTVFYTRQDPQTLRSYQVWRHELGTDPANDELIFEEKDDTFRCFVTKTKSKRFLMIASSQTLSTEYRYLDANDPKGEFQVFLPREKDHEYSIDHFGDHFFIYTNDAAKNYRLMKTPITATAKQNWSEVIPHRSDALLEGFEIFKDYLVLRERENGLVQMRVRPWNGRGEHYLDFGEPAYAARLSQNRSFDTSTLRFTYSSMTTPNSVFDYDMSKRERKLLKQDEVLGGFDKNNYVTERHYAEARDGAKVPISLVYRKGTKKDGKSPLLLTGYGSYGSSRDASFSASRLSLLDRGFVYAIAHIRGGQEMGRHWYENGKLFKKKNTFTDFIDCGEYLVSEKFTRPEKMFAQGGSAGGLLMGAVVNMRPDLFHGVIAAVPFVDVVTTMLDDSIPLTTFEYDEWGNPNQKDYYEYMLSYSPYDQVAEQDYPHMLVTTGLHDSQVQYWEPAKWVAKLRAMKTGDNVLLMRTNMEAGHGGGSGRTKRYEETAFSYAFLLDHAGWKNAIQ